MAYGACDSGWAGFGEPWLRLESLRFFGWGFRVCSGLGILGHGFKGIFVGLGILEFRV